MNATDLPDWTRLRDFEVLYQSKLHGIHQALKVEEEKLSCKYLILGEMNFISCSYVNVVTIRRS